MSPRLCAALVALLSAAPLVAQDRVVHDAAGLKAALGSDRTIVLEAGDYVFESALRIEGMKNLTLRGRDRGTTRILARDDYADVVVVTESENVTFERLTMGHHPDVAYCVGGVLAFHRSRDVRALQLTLFGSGVEGLTFTAVDGALVEGVEIRECTSAGMSVASSRDVLVRDSTFHENELYEAIFHVHSTDLVVEDTRVAHSGDDAVPLVKTDSLAYYVDGDEYEAREDGEPGTFTMRRGSIAGDVKLPLTGKPGVLLEGVDQAEVARRGGEECRVRIKELEEEVLRLRQQLEEARGSGH